MVLFRNSLRSMPSKRQLVMHCIENQGFAPETVSKIKWRYLGESALNCHVSRRGRCRGNDHYY